ncbi:phage tail sheath subtilisin-like domain-containing protein [Veillonella magna]|uniref:phage tail sheath subtilisin-like domain-containing protein n=1 Tax=Veillonella magna TaxID=464322 RepID=UPI0023F10142|nr:phage tail sheath subtilisin-like domain-containing protein [Veillonella magna]
MANEQELFGMPEIFINFRTKGTTAIKRSARGIVLMILHNETIDEIKRYRINDVADIPEKGISEDNVDLIKKTLLGTPLRILLYTVPTTEVESAENTLADVLKLIDTIKFNWLCAPNATEQEAQDIASWIKTQRNIKRKTFKAVLAHQAADDKGIVNFCAEDIKVQKGKSEDGTPVYKTYTATEYTGRIAGILAGLPLDRSATYYKLTEVVSVRQHEDINTLIDKGELHLIDEEDGDGVKIARAGNSLTTFTTDVGEKFRKIKIVEGVDMVTDDLRDTFKKYYAGKCINDYDHKMLFCAAAMVYFDGLKGNVLDKDGKNTIDIDEKFQRNYAILDGANVEEMSAMEIRKYNTGDKLALTGNLVFVDAMENLTIDFTM